MNRIAGRVSWRGCVSSLAALCLLAGGQGCGEESESGGATATDRADEPSATAEASPRQLERFALLRTPPEGLPADTERILGRPVAGMNWELAQRIPIDVPGLFWLVPGRGHLCIVQQGSLGAPGVGTTCAPTRQAIRHGVANVTINRGAPGSGAGRARQIVGVAPDGTHQVLVRTRGSVVAVPARDQIFRLRDSIAAAPDTLSLR